LRQGLAHLLAPDVLADRHAELDAAEIDRLGARTRREDALLVEHAVIGQVVLVAHALDAAAIKQSDRVIDERSVAPGKADEDRRAAVSRVVGKLLAGSTCRLLQSRLQHQILNGVAGEIKLGEGDQVGTGRCRLSTRLPRLLEIPLKIAHDRVELRQRELERVLDLMRHVLSLPGLTGQSSNPGSR
jgi:hypothetical protein